MFRGAIHRRPKIGALVFFLSFVAPVAAQEGSRNDVLIRGNVRADENNGPIAQAMVIIVQDSIHQASLFTNTEGYYEHSLQRDHLYTLRYEAKKRVSKWITIDTRGIPDEEWVGGFGMIVDMKLFRKSRKKDVSFLEFEAMGHATWDGATENITWDLPYTEAMRARVLAARNRH